MTMADELYDSFLELSPDAVIIIDNVGTVEYFNEQAEFLWKRRRSEVLGTSIDELLPERFRGRHTKHRAEYIAEPRRRSMGQGLELYGLRSDGIEFAVDISLGPIVSGGGQRYVAVVRDVTAQRNAVAVIRQTIILTQAWMQQLSVQLDRLG